MSVSPPFPVPRPARRRRRKILAITTLGLAGLLAGLLTGCSGSNGTDPAAAASAQSYAAVSGNWKFTSGTSAQLATFAGSLAVAGSTVTGVLHPVASTCVASAASFPVAGSIDSDNRLSLSSNSFSGGTLAVAGTLATDQHSLLNPTLAITDGACATPAVSSSSGRDDNLVPTVQQYQPITGNYAGTFTSNTGGSLTVDATLSQPTTPDANGNYHLTGSATFSDTSCIGAPVVTQSTVSGNILSATYTDSAGNTVSGNGTFSPDAQTLTITSWTLTGSCGSDAGTGLLTLTP